MERLVGWSVTVMLENQVIEEEQRDVIFYGLDLLYSSIISMLSFVFFGLLLKQITVTMILLLFFIPLQSFGGGYHCQTHFRCWLLMMIGYIFAIFVLLKLPIYILLIVALVGSPAALVFAPIENPEAPFGEDFRRKMRKIFMAVFFVALILVALLSVSHMMIAGPILVAVILSEVSITSAKIKQFYKERK